MDVGLKPAGIVIVSLLLAGLAAGADQRLVNAAADQDKATLRALIKQNVNVNEQRADGSTALLFAAHWNDLETVDLLLRSGAKVDTADDHGVTPLAQAVENGNLALVERLLKAGANPNTAESSGLSPLMVACHTGNLAVVKALLAKGANVNAVTGETKNTALMWAVSDRFPEVVKVLIAAHADVHASTAKSFTPLMHAARNGDIEMAKILIAAGAKVNDPSSDGTNVLPFALVAGQADFALFLLDQGADPNGQMSGIRPLHAASGTVDIWMSVWLSKHGRGYNPISGLGFRSLDPSRAVTVIKALLAKGADPNARTTTSGMLMSYIGYPKKGAFEPFAVGTGDLRGATPLWVAAYTANGSAAMYGNASRGMGRQDMSGEVIRTLLAAGADLKLTTDDGTTPLMVAAGLGRFTFSPGITRGGRSQGAEEAVKILVEAGADVNAVNEADFAAIHGAAFRGLDEVLQYLVDHGANINARDFRGRTPYRIAEGSKQSFQFQAYPETADFIKEKLHANTRLGIPGSVQERVRDVPAAGPLAKAQ